MSFGGKSAFALGPGPSGCVGQAATPNATSGSGPCIGGSTVFANFLNATSAVQFKSELPYTAVDAYSGYQIGVVYDSTKVTALSVGDDSVGAGLWGSDFCPPPVLNNNLGGTLPVPLLASIFGCVSTGGPTMLLGNLGHLNVKYIGTTAPVSAFHMIPYNNPLVPNPPDVGGGAGAGTFTVNAADNGAQKNTLQCDGQICGPLPVAGSESWDVVFQVGLPPSDVTITKSATTSPIIEGNNDTFTITVTNPSPVGNATPTLDVKDTVPAAFGITGAVNVVYGGGASGPATCTVTLQVVDCPGVILPPAGGTATITINVTSLAGSGGTSPQNCATFTSSPADASANDDSACATVQIQPKNVGFKKFPTMANLWLAENCDPTLAGSQCFGQETNTGSFDEIMSNAQDPHGLGGVSWDIHWDPTQFQGFVLCNSNAAAAEDTDPDALPGSQPEATEGGAGTPTNACPATGGFVDIGPIADLMSDFGRSADCTMTQTANGVDHIACASTGTFGSGPVFAGDQVVAHVHKVPQDLIRESIRPNKENGDVSVIKDDQVTVTNTCGQPLNQGDGNAAECQGTNLGGVCGGGVLCSPVSVNVETIRRLEGDVNRDCSVNVQDMQIEASKFGTSTGSLLFSTFFDVNEPLQHGDGEIDINDVQFVFGRFGSECIGPTIPPQNPQPAP